MSSVLLSDLNSCSGDEFVATLGNVFEHSPWIAERAAMGRPFENVRQLFDAMKAVVDQTTPDLRLEFIRGHPDLANKAQRAAGLTAESSAEQNGAGLDRLSDAEFQAFERVNNAYRAKFGFPYIVCARRHTKDSILRDFEHRLPNDHATEMQNSIHEIYRIAALRERFTRSNSYFDDLDRTLKLSFLCHSDNLDALALMGWRGRILLPHYRRFAARNSVTGASEISGASSCGKWPKPGSATNLRFGKAFK